MADDYLRALGLFEEWPENLHLLHHSKVMSVEQAGFDHIACYLDASGYSLALFETLRGFASESLAVHGAPGCRAYGYQVRPGLAVIEPLDDQDEIVTRVLAFVNDPQLYPECDISNVTEVAQFDEYQLGAVAVDMQLYDSVAQWDAEQEAIDGTEVKIGPKFVASPWLFALHQGTASADEAGALSMLKAVIEDVTVAVNELTGQQWYRLLVDCDSFKCMLAMPFDTQKVPQVGGVVDGNAFLTGTSGFWDAARAFKS